VSNAVVGLDVFIFYSHSSLKHQFQNRSNNVINNNNNMYNMYVTTNRRRHLVFLEVVRKKLIVKSIIVHVVFKRQDYNISLLFGLVRSHLSI